MQSVFPDNIPYLFDLVRFCFAAVRLYVDDFFYVIMPINEVASSGSVFKAEIIKQSLKVRRSANRILLSLSESNTAAKILRIAVIAKIPTQDISLSELRFRCLC